MLGLGCTKICASGPPPQSLLESIDPKLDRKILNRVEGSSWWGVFRIEGV